ncbi:NAD(P)/FAD-dependent oxidoreductase, partial [Accumulibacter sp.]|uniref:NAD(P)/FAD-dependent oxidoreductase n=1 Tax=Accumulibacter sp. TaxID=2053492 RepID=UPI0039187B61
MLRISEIRLPIDHTPEDLPAAVAARLGIALADLGEVHVFRRSQDARKASALMFSYGVDVAVPDEALLLEKFANDQRVQPTPDMRYHFVGQAPSQLASRPIVVGFGPAGIFAALILAQSGFRPIVLERGKAVRERTQDTWGLWRKKVLDPESNVQFGEGGAGTFSDGKLYSQIKDPQHHGRKVLQEFVKAGAPEEILYVSKPHIGTFRLVAMVEQMRREIERLGGEIRFQQRLTGLHLEQGRV